MIANSRANEIKVNEDQQERIDLLRNDFRLLFAMIESSYCKSSRETSLGITKLEESLMWLIKGISREEKDSDE